MIRATGKEPTSDELARRVRQLESELAAAEQRAERHLKSLRAFMQFAMCHDTNGRLEAGLRKVVAKLDEDQPCPAA